MSHPVVPSSSSVSGEIVLLNVGGKRFSTSRQTLTWIPDSFFSSLMSGRIPSVKDERGAIFIDRDPDVFGSILNFLRTRNIDTRNVDLKRLKHEAEFFGIQPLVKRLAVCDELDKSCCGSLLFFCKLLPPVFDMLAQGEAPDTLPQPQLALGLKTDFSRQVLQIVGHGNCIAVSYNHCVCVLAVRESKGWEVVFTTPTLERVPQRIALNTRSVGAQGGPILAAVVGSEIRVWSCSPSPQVIATFDMKIPVDGLFFIGMQLVAISNTGKVAVWQSVQRHWQLQDVEPICSYDAAGSFLLLGCANGSIYYIDMEKFPVRMKDNDLLVTQMFEDPCKEPITALSVYVTSHAFPGSTQNWMELAYGTRAGTVRVVVRHPENIGQAPQVFQTYNVHTCPIMKVVLGEKHLISVCAENHVRTWTMTRFRGRISTQPGSNPIASFKVLSLEGAHSLYYPVNSIGPFGERDEEQVFIQRVIPETDRVFVRSSSTGNRVCKVDAVDGSNISAYCVHECEAINRIGMRSKRFIFTGHLNGTIQVWDLTTALELAHKATDSSEGGPTKAELLDLLQHCEVCGSSRLSSAVSSRAPSPSPSLMSIIYPGLKPVSGRDSLQGTPLNTPLLGRPLYGVGKALGNLFQPIRVPHSNSNTSITSSDPNGAIGPANLTSNTTTAASVSKQTTRDEIVPITDNQQPVGGSDVDTRSDKQRESGEEDQNSTAKSSASPLVPTELEEEHRETISQKTTPVHQKEPLVETSTHQRSRSNEIDYMSADAFNSRSKVTSAFRTPSDSGFRPLSVDSARGSLTSGTLSLRSRPSSYSSVRRTSSSSTASRGSEVTLTSEDNAQRSRLGSLGSRESESTSANWFKELDSSFISDYFGSSEQIEQYLRSDEPLLKITDC